METTYSACAPTVWLPSISVTHSRCRVGATILLLTKEATVHAPVISPTGEGPHNWFIAQAQLFPIKGEKSTKKKINYKSSFFFSPEKQGENYDPMQGKQPVASASWTFKTRLLLTLDDQSQREVEVLLHKAHVKVCSIFDAALKTHGLEKTLCALWWLVSRMQTAPAFMWASNYRPQLWSLCSGRGAGRKVPCLTFKNQTFSLAFSLHKSGKAKGA